jgi:macrolide transport system ATP-binding/permease protein
MWRKRKQQDFNAELEAHLQLEADQLRSEGLTPDNAQAAARRALGNRTAAEERFYESSRWMPFQHFFRDLRFATRVLLKDARFSMLAILGLALGIGISTAIFALITAMMRLEDRADLQDPKSYVGLISRGRDTALSYADFRYYQQRATSLGAVSAESGRWGFIMNPVSPGEEAEDVEGRFESADFLSVIGMRTALGRTFAKEEEQAGGPSVALLNFHFWQRRFSGDPGVLGKTVVLNNHAVTIIGVADARFAPADGAGFYLPLELQPLLSGGDLLHAARATWLIVGAHLRRGVTRQQAQAEIDVLLSPSLGRDDLGVSVSEGGPINPQKRREILTAVVAVIVAVSMILLIACSNLANLLLARAVVRRREIGVRLSLGASRARLVGQLLTESMLLATAGGILGMVFSSWLAKAVFVLVNPTPGLTLQLDPIWFLYGVALSLVTGVSFGLGPALAATKTDLARALHSEGMSGTPGSPSERIWAPRNLLVIVPLAVSLMLLIAAGLAIRLVERTFFSGPGFDATHLIAMSFRLNSQGYDQARTVQFQEDLRSRIAGMPGVSAVTLAAAGPISGGTGVFPIVSEGSAISSEESLLHVECDVVSAGFFEILGVPVVRGRAFAASDRDGAAPVVMVSQELVRRYWPAEEPLGKRIRLRTGSSYFEVIGVAQDLDNPRLTSAQPVVYVSLGQARLLLAGAHPATPPYQMQFLIRTSGDPAALKKTLHREAVATDSSLWVSIQTLQELREESVGPIRMFSLLLSALGALALLMASVGIYAILAYAVSQRTREIGIRMALGAQRREVMALVMRRTVVLIAWGIGAGFLGALAVSRVLAKGLGEIGGLDPVTCVSVALLLGAVALLASYLPSRKALRVDPVQALRCE